MVFVTNIEALYCHKHFIVILKHFNFLGSCFLTMMIAEEKMIAILPWLRKLPSLLVKFVKTKAWQNPPNMYHELISLCNCFGWIRNWDDWKNWYEKTSSFEMRAWKKLLGIAWRDHRSNRSILEEVNMEERLLQESSTCSTYVFRHTARQDSRSLVKQIIIGCTMQSIGRHIYSWWPRHQWCDASRKSVENGLNKLVKNSKNREEWRAPVWFTLIITKLLVKNCPYFCKHDVRYSFRSLGFFHKIALNKKVIPRFSGRWTFRSNIVLTLECWLCLHQGIRGTSKWPSLYLHSGFDKITQFYVRLFENWYDNDKIFKANDCGFCWS